MRIYVIAIVSLLPTVAPITPAAAADLSLATADTSVTIDARDGRLAVTSLQNTKTGWDWVGRSSTADIPLISSVEVGGNRVPVVWRMVGISWQGATAKKVTIAFRNVSPALELQSVWEARSGPGPVEHTITIRNVGKAAVVLPLQQSIRFAARPARGHSLERWWVEKGAGAPTDTGTHHDPVTAGFDRRLTTLPYTEDNLPRDAIPWSAVQDIEGRQGFYTGVEFSGRVSQSLRAIPATERSGQGVYVECGLSPEPAGSPPYRHVILPGQTFQAPIVFVGCYAGDVEDGANRLRRWVAANLRPRVHEPNYPLLTLNSWGSGMAVDQALAERMIEDGAALGLEMFHIDAGWFRGVGDWRPNPAKFPHGLGPVADRAHARGMRFGLWVGWTQGGIQPDAEDRQAILNVFAPDRRDWFAKNYPPDWKPADFTGADLCLSVPAAQDWCISMLDRLIRECKLDMLEHDQRMIVDSCAQTDHPHTDARTEIAYAAANGYYRVYDAIRARHPDLLFEDCVNGGRTVDYGILQRVHYVSITDVYNPLANRRAFYDASYALPPAMCECYIENERVGSLAEFRTMLRSGMMGWCTIMCDPNQWNAEQHAAACRQFEVYKQWLRPLINHGDLYHVTERPEGKQWDGIQYADPAGKTAVLMAFRGTNPESSHIFRLRGLDPSAKYHARFEDGSIPPVDCAGRELISNGLEVRLHEAGSSQIVYLQRSGDSSPRRREGAKND